MMIGMPNHSPASPVKAPEKPFTLMICSPCVYQFAMP